MSTTYNANLPTSVFNSPNDGLVKFTLPEQFDEQNYLNDIFANNSTWNNNSSTTDNIFKGWDFDTEGNLVPNITSPDRTMVDIGKLPTDSNFDWFNKTNLGLAGQGLGLVGGLANLYSNLWGQNAEVMDKQMALMDQQLAHNDTAAKNRKQFADRFAQGLAGSLTPSTTETKIG